ncbi:unnamed protein product [Schistosoma turkestanicum]|nr:unnamed protein product [Schistosoma turkestanicum]
MLIYSTLIIAALMCSSANAADKTNGLIIRKCLKLFSGTFRGQWIDICESNPNMFFCLARILKSACAPNINKYMNPDQWILFSGRNYAGRCTIVYHGYCVRRINHPVRSILAWSYGDPDRNLRRCLNARSDVYPVSLVDKMNTDNVDED